MTDSDRIVKNFGAVRVLAKPGYPPSCDIVVQVMRPAGWWVEVYRVNDVKDMFALEKASAFAEQTRKGEAHATSPDPL